MNIYQLARPSHFLTNHLKHLDGVYVQKWYPSLSIHLIWKKNVIFLRPTLHLPLLSFLIIDYLIIKWKKLLCLDSIIKLNKSLCLDFTERHCSAQDRRNKHNDNSWIDFKCYILILYNLTYLLKVLFQINSFTFCVIPAN